MFQNIRFALRILTRRPLYTIVILLTLTLGIGANSAIFTLVSTAFLRPLPYKNSERLVTILLSPTGADGELKPIYPPEIFTQLEQVTDLFEDLAGYVAASNIGFDLIGGDYPERVQGAVVSARFFEVLGVKARLGRFFADNEDRPGDAMVAVISHGLWVRRWGADPAIIGQLITLNGRGYTVIGVVPPGFDFDGAAEIWVPGPLDAGRAMNTALFVTYSINVIGHLRPGLSVREAESRLKLVGEDQGLADLKIVPLQEQTHRRTRPALLLLFGAVILVLLIACTNVAVLVISRTVSRNQEFSIRLALGAGRWRIIQQLMTESFVLALLGGCLGLALSHWIVGLLNKVGPPDVARLSRSPFDWRILAVTLGATLLAALFFGVVPALHASRTDVSGGLKEGARGFGVGLQRQRFLRITMTCEIAISLVLLLAAGAMLKSLLRLISIDLGYNPNNAFTMKVALEKERYPNTEAQLAFYDRAIERIRRLPRITEAGWTTALPIGGGGFKVLFNSEAQPVTTIEESPSANCAGITGGYFQAMGIPVLQGRTFIDSDTQSSSKVVIVDEALTRRFWPTEPVLGKRVNWQGSWREVVGVVRQVRGAGMEGEVQPHIYVPYSQFDFTWPYMHLIVRTNSVPDLAAPLVRQAIWDENNDQPVTDARTMERAVSALVAPQKFNAALLSAFALVSLALAGLGVYGVIAFSVAQRTHEIGVRISFGATPSSVLRLLMAASLKLLSVGIVAGLIAAVALSRVLRTFLYEVSPTDTGITIAAVGVVACAALIAAYVPARKATRLDPITALRTE